MSLFKKVLSGGKWTSIESGYTALLQLIRLYILTKLLIPSDFGLMAMGMIVIGFSRLFANFGLSAAIIYKKNITNKQLSSLYCFNILVGLVICFIVFFSSEIIAEYVFQESRLVPVLQIIGFVFIISSFSTQYSALLKKHLKFTELAKINIISLTAGFTITLVLAYLGKGVYALVYGLIAESILGSLLSIIAGRQFHIPRLYFKLSEIKYYLSFGGYQFGQQMISYLREEGDSLIIGAFLSVETLGVYSVAKQLVIKPIRLIRSIYAKMAFPVYSNIQDQKQLNQWVISIFKLMMALLLPIMGLLIVFPDIIITYFYGSNWDEATVLIRLLAILFSLRILRDTFGPLLISRGKVKIAFYYNLVFSTIAIAVMLIAIRYSINYVLYGLIAIEILLMQPLNFIYIMNPVLGLKLKEYSSLMMTVIIPFIIFLFITSYLYIVFSDVKLHVFNGLIFVFGYLICIALFYLLNKETVKLVQAKFSTKKR